MSRERAQAEIDTARAWRGLFLDGQGNVKPDAMVVLRDMEKVTGWMVSSLPTGSDGHVDPLRLAAHHERRGIYAHIKKRLFGDLDSLIGQIERKK